MLRHRAAAHGPPAERRRGRHGDEQPRPRRGAARARHRAWCACRSATATSSRRCCAAATSSAASSRATSSSSSTARPATAWSPRWPCWRCMVESGKPLSELRQVMRRFPQVLVNVPVRERRDLDVAARGAEGDRPRQRASSASAAASWCATRAPKPLVRVMVEGEQPAQVERFARRSRRRCAISRGGMTAPKA